MACDPDYCNCDLSCRDLDPPPLADFMLDPEWVYLITVDGRTYASDRYVAVDIDQIKASAVPSAPGDYDLTCQPPEMLHPIGPDHVVTELLPKAFARGVVEASDAEPVTWSAWAEHGIRIGVTATGRPVAVNHAWLSRLDYRYRLKAARRHRHLVIFRDATVCGVIAGADLGDLTPIHHAIIAQLTTEKGVPSHVR